MIEFSDTDVEQLAMGQRFLRNWCAVALDPRAAGKCVVLVMNGGRYEVNTFENDGVGRVAAHRLRDSLPEKNRHVGMQPFYVDGPGEGNIVMY